MRESITTTRLGTVLIIALGSALALGACSTAPSGDASESSSAAASDDASESAGSPAAGLDEAFPVTVETGYGEITLTEKPERIVVLAAQYSDILGAMDVVPVVTSISPGLADADSVVAAFPWLEGVDLGDVDDTLIGADYAASLEAIAAYEPDLILANTWQVTEETFPRISEIAPTFTGTYYGNNDWNVLTEALGVLTGEEEAAVAAISGLEDTYAEVRAQFPELEGLTYYTTRYDTNGFGFGNGSWLDGFGMKPGERQDNTQSSETPVSLENIDQVDSDFLSIWYWEADPATVHAHPGYAELPSVRNGLIHESSDMAFANATNSAGPLSLAWAIDQIVPLFEGSALHQG